MKKILCLFLWWSCCRDLTVNVCHRTNQWKRGWKSCQSQKDFKKEDKSKKECKEKMECLQKIRNAATKCTGEKCNGKCCASVPNAKKRVAGKCEMKNKEKCAMDSTATCEKQVWRNIMEKKCAMDSTATVWEAGCEETHWKENALWTAQRNVRARYEETQGKEDSNKERCKDREK